MTRALCARTLGIALLLVPARSDAQQRTPPVVMGSGAIVAPRPSPLAPMRFGSLPPSNASRPWGGPRRFDGVGDRFGHRPGLRPTLGRGHFGFLGSAYTAPVAVAYEVPVYVPVPVPVWTRPYALAPEAPARPYDPTKSKMLTIGGGADGGGGVMRIERERDSTLRITWLGSTRAVREARLFLADSAQRLLRSAFVDERTPGALFRIADLEGEIAYTGLTIVFADGATQTTLVPYRSEEHTP